MKNLHVLDYLSGLLFTLFLILSSCTKTDLDELSSTSKQVTADKELLTSLGYDTSDLVRLDTCYIVEGDICLTDSHMTSLRNIQQTRHTYSQWPYTVNEKNRTIRVSTVGGFSSDRSIVLQALNYWNEDIKCGLHFQEDASSDITIEFTSNTNPAGGVEAATPPTIDGKPGSKITIYDQTTAYFQADNTQKKYLIVHALGHAVGFGHTPTNISEYNATSNSHILGTAQIDPKSIMVKPATTLKWSGVSESDKQAFLKVYPYSAPSLYMSCDPYDPKFQLNKAYTFRAYYKNDISCPNPEFRFTVTSKTSEQPTYQVISNGILKISFPIKGTYEIKVTVTNASSPIEAKETIQIYDEKPTLTISPEEPIEIGKTYRLNVSFDNPNAGTNPVFNFTAKDALFGNEATLTPVDNKSCDIVFTKPGKYEINASLKSNSTIQAPPLSLTVYSNEIIITRASSGIFTTHYDYQINASYYSDIYPDNKFKFTITSTPEGTQSYSIKKVDKDNITICFYKVGDYTLRVEIEGAPEIYKEQTLFVTRQLSIIGITIAPKEPIEIGKTYRVSVPGDMFEYPGDREYDFTARDWLFGHNANITKIDTRSSSIVFTGPGEYEITALGDKGDHTSTTVSVYSKEISIQRIFYLATGDTKGTYGFEASYYSDIHPNPEFKFTILDPNPSEGFQPIYYTVRGSSKTSISYKFYIAGEYILRTEIVGAPGIYTDYPFKVTGTADLKPIRPIE